MENHIGQQIAQKRKDLGYTQQKLADVLKVSFQAVSKWERGSTTPDIALLPEIARILNTTVDVLVGYQAKPMTHYEDKYREEDFYWGLEPNKMCYEVMRLRPPVKPYRVLDIGCGEGKDAVFFARNGYRVTAFDIADAGLEKARRLAEYHRVDIDFFKGDVNDFRLDQEFDIIFSSGVFHYIGKEQRERLIGNLKEHTAVNGIHAIKVFVQKPFLEPAPDLEEQEKRVEPWYSGELAGYYHDWLFHQNEEIIFDCNSGGIPHKHCMDILIGEKPGL